MGHQLSLSFELVCLLDWLITHKKDDLSRLIKQAVDSDFTKGTSAVDTSAVDTSAVDTRAVHLEESEDDFAMLDMLYKKVIDFVLFLTG